MAYGSEVTYPANPEKAYDADNHYTFAGWKTADGTVINPGTASLMVVGEATYTATYTATEHIYEYKQNSDNATHTGTCVCGATVSDDCSGGTADCENAAVCTVCKEAYGDAKGHDYDKTKSETNLTRPVQNADGTWTDGYYTYTCKNDSAHTTTERVARADYSDYDSAVKNLEELLKTDITDEAKEAINEALDTNKIDDNLIASEKVTVIDPATEKLVAVFEQYKGSLKTYTVTFIVDGETIKTETVISGNAATAPADPTKAFDTDYHYTFSKWDVSFVNVTEDLTVTAVFTEQAHTMGNWEVTAKASCTEMGTKRQDCSACDHFVTESIAKRAHVYTDNGVQTAATCKAEGVMNTICTNVETETHKACTHESTRVIPVDPNAHKWETEYTVDTKASCDAAGSKSYHCEYCDTINTDSVVEIAKREHNLVDTTVALEPTCSATGIMNQKCACEETAEYEACDYTTTRVMEKVADAHKWETEYTVDTKASCDAAGSKSYHCEYCDTINTDSVVEIAKREHNLVDTTVQKAPTCSATGIMNQKCDCAETAEYEACDYTTTRVLDKVADAHKWETEYTVDEKASCDKAGSKSYHCEYCDTINTDSVVEIAKREHNLVDTTVALEPTCSATGIMNQKCACEETAEYEACEYTTTRVLDKVADAHKWETEYTVDEKASCDKAGSKSYHCEYCDTINTDSVVEIAKREHNLVDTTVALEPTCSATGIMNQKCDCEETAEYEACDYTTTRVMETVADAHKAEADYTVMQKASCEADGYKAILCEYCDAELSKQIIAKREHNLVDTTVQKAPTCTETGIMNQKCDCAETAEYEACDYTTTRELDKDATNHAGTANVVKNDKAATCTDEGYTGDTYWSCCDALYSKGTVISKLAHTEEAVAGYEATCTQNGLTDGVKCSVCGEILTAQEVIPATGHSYEATVTEPTCTEDGYTTYTCACGDSYTETIEAPGHAWSTWTFVSGSCADGKVVFGRECARCDAEETEERTTSNAGHTVPVDADGDALYDTYSAPNCTRDGLYTFTCAICETKEIRITAAEDPSLKAYGHKWVVNEETDSEGWIIISEPTCFRNGAKYRVCANGCATNCGLDPNSKEIVVIPATNHEGTLIKVPAKAATCTEDGYTAHYYCTECGTDQGKNVIAATGHKDENNDGKCDGCETPVGESRDCRCICHKQHWFMRFIYKIVRFFWKLFKIGKVCDCGFVHY